MGAWQHICVRPRCHGVACPQEGRRGEERGGRMLLLRLPARRPGRRLRCHLLHHCGRCTAHDKPALLEWRRPFVRAFTRARLLAAAVCARARTAATQGLCLSISLMAGNAEHERAARGRIRGARVRARRGAWVRAACVRASAVRRARGKGGHLGT